MKASFLTLAATLVLTSLSVFADDDTFRERFADPATRDAALAELIPGTRDAYFHTALAHQLAGREAEAKATLAAWQLAANRKGHPISLSGYSTLENRRILLEYQKSPESSLAELIRALDLDFSDTQPDAEAAASLPTRLDPAHFSEAAFQALTDQQNPTRNYTTYSNKRLYRELAEVETFDDSKTRYFLEHLDRADLPGVVPLVARSLRMEKPVLFDGVPFHKNLTAGQLAELLKLRPELTSSESFARTWLEKLRPGTETDFARDPAAHAAHLQRCRDFVLTLPPALNSLKAHVLFHHLRLQAALGNYPKDDFLAFLALPRVGHPLLKAASPEAAKAIILLTLDFSSSTACPPVRDDTALIHDYLQHFLALADSAAAFAAYIPAETLSPLHARARLLAGADPTRWAAALDPAAYRDLQQETRIVFAQEKPALVDSEAAITLDLDLKNTPDLLVRIYELDLPAHLGRGESEPKVDIDLDGLVPHHQRRLAFPQNPIVQHRERIDLPELAGPGAWLVDFVSGQVSARALIRKGRLIAWPDRSTTGQTLRVFDEHTRPVANAMLALGAESFTADADGLITIPNSAEHPLKSGVLSAGKLATEITLGSREDDLALDARFHLDREQLLADCETRLQLRVRLTNHGRELPLSRLTNPSLILRGELLGGITTERVIAENLALKPAQEISFQVPGGLRKLVLVLRATVTPPTGADPITLTAETSYALNAALDQNTVATAFIAPTSDGHRLDLRGRNGEPIPNRALTLTAARYDYKAEPKTEVRSDEHGHVQLGTLESIDYLSVSGTGIETLTYDPRPDFADCESTLQITPDDTVRLPLVRPCPAPDRLRFSLLEILDEHPVRDHFDALAIDHGQLVIRGLPPGDFQLTIDDDTIVTLLVSAGSAHHGLLVSPTRILPRHLPAHPVIAAASAAAGQLTLQLRDFDPATRISLVGKRFQDDEWSPGSGLYPYGPPVPDSLRPGFLTCGYLTDRLIGDEMRYILDRRAAKTFPGSMLPRAGLLLNRWQDETIGQEKRGGLDAAGGGSGGGFGSIPAMMKRKPGSDRDSSGSSQHQPACDFLARPAVVHFDLTPAADGSLTLPLASFKDCQFIEITATTPYAHVTHTLPLPPSEPPLRDRRLARPLDPALHYHATQRAAYLAKGASASIENLLDADWRAFTTLADAHQFLYGVCADDKLGKFVFLTEWPDLSEEKKLELLAAHACHELHLFLARKDKPFFEKHIKPLLAQKPAPTFIDDLLLGRDLGSYLRPYAWQRLNAAEKALLAQALPAARERISRELKLRWELEAPTPEQETILFTQTLRGTSLELTDSLGLARRDLLEESEGPTVSSGIAYLDEKLRRIIIPTVNFEDITVEEAIDFLRQRAVELDTESDPSRKGVNFLIKENSAMVPGGDAGLDAAAGLASGSIGAIKIRSLRLNNMPLGQVLKYICEKAKLRYKTDDYAVTLVPLTDSGEENFTRIFRVPQGFEDALAQSSAGGGGGASDVDPFADTSPTAPGLRARTTIIDLLRENGISFPPGSSATLTPSGILVTNTASELDKIQSLTAITSSGARLEAAPSVPGFASGDAPATEFDEDSQPDSDSASDPFSASEEVTAVDPFAGPLSGSGIRRRPAPRPLFRDLTMVWRESNYYRHGGATGEAMIPLNRFWLDLAAWDGKGLFLSPHFNACTHSANEALMCLAMLDLPFKAARPEVVVDGSTLRVKAREPMLLFYKDTRKADQVAPESPLLVRQSFCPLGEPFRTVAGEQVENPVTGDFRPGVPYTLSLTITNPTGIGRRIEVLAQIPAGAIPLGGHPATLSETHQLEPNGVLNLEMACYFPAAGEFSVYPLHVTRNGTVLAHAEPRSLRVSNKPEPRDAAAWSVLAAEGTAAEVLARLAIDNLKTVDLAAIRWRLKDRGFFLKTMTILRDRLYFSPQLAAYGFHHNDPASIREYLENSEAARQIGAWFDSPLITVRPRIHHDWETLEFDPLVNPRAHRFTSASRLTHQVARDHYHAFLDQLAWKPALDDSDQLTLAAFLFLQDRVEEALARFDRIDPAKLPGRLHYDYFHTLVLCYREKPAEARAIAVTTLPALPPGLWHDRFQTVVDQVDELADLTSPAAKPPAAAALTPQLDLAMAGSRRLLIKHRGLEAATLDVFSVDLEVMFSKDPFLTGSTDGGGRPAIRANQTLNVPLTKDASETTVELPPALRQGNLLVSAKSGTTKLLKVLDSAAFDLRQNPIDRTIQVLDAATGRPLPKTYIKVYAETTTGETLYHKDGYTDLRGKFDYLSHTGVDPASIKRVALLVSHPEKGARTVIYDR